MDKQKIISSKKVFSSQLFDVKEEIFSMDKKEFVFQTAYGKSVASIVPITDKGDIYLIDQYRPALKKRILGIVSGMIEDKESSIQAAKRELEEETGIIARQLELLAKIELARGTFIQTHFLFLAKEFEIGMQNLQEDEDIEVVQMPLKEAVQRVMNGQIYHSVSMAAILMLDKLKQQKRI